MEILKVTASRRGQEFFAGRKGGSSKGKRLTPARLTGFRIEIALNLSFLLNLWSFFVFLCLTLTKNINILEMNGRLWPF